MSNLSSSSSSSSSVSCSTSSSTFFRFFLRFFIESKGTGLNPLNRPKKSLSSNSESILVRGSRPPSGAMSTSFRSLSLPSWKRHHSGMDSKVLLISCSSFACFTRSFEMFTRKAKNPCEVLFRVTSNVMSFLSVVPSSKMYRTSWALYIISSMISVPPVFNEKRTISSILECSIELFGYFSKRSKRTSYTPHLIRSSLTIRQNLQVIVRIISTASSLIPPNTRIFFLYVVSMKFWLLSSLISCTINGRMFEIVFMNWISFPFSLTIALLDKLDPLWSPLLSLLVFLSFKPSSCPSGLRSNISLSASLSSSLSS
mmetsp:Transcript_13184/g.15267  ORF Transcript_13184/g.15267 Transcript_13184/m.15267 type:complete len:313 (-) Transcript_13184:135-1073(-)